ncbi:hypothetical protein GCM10009111_35120 [Colwellia asteriadis]|uniref:Phage protein n=1 Tax=Colwellia asteriadis TaxID=517723 RepID=A0ABN1LBK0_9GAMM
MLKTKKELTFSEKQLKEIVEKIMEYYGINSNNINIFNDKIEFRFDYDFGTVFGIYHETRYIRLFFEKRNNMLKLTKIELEK